MEVVLDKSNLLSERPKMDEPVQRVYVIVDKNLSAGAKVAQAGHAIVQLSLSFPFETEAWTNNGNTLIILETDLGNLYYLNQVLMYSKADWEHFTEPDFGNILTAIAVFGTLRVQNTLRGFPLAKGGNPWREHKSRKLETEFRKLHSDS